LIRTTDIMTEHKQIPRESENLLRRHQALMKAATEGIHIMDIQGNVIEANDVFCRMLGYTQEEVTKLNVADWEAQFSREEVQGKFKRLVGNTSIIQSIHRRKDGTLINVEISSTGVEIEGINYIVSLSRDISESQRIEKETDKLLRRYQTLMKNSLDAIRVMDIEGNVVEVNDAFCRQLGYTHAEALKLNIVDWDAQWTKDELQKRFRSFIGKKGGATFETVQRRKDGTLINVEVTNTAIEIDGEYYFFAASRDITERKRAEAALKNSESWFRSVFENVHTGIASTDSSGQVINFNETFCTMMGYDAESLRRMNFADFTHPDDLQLEKVFFDEILAGKRDHYHIKKRYIANHGRILWVDLSAAAIRDTGGTVSNFVAVIQDITERKAAEDEIEHLAFYDSLTQLPNRRLLLDRLKQALAASSSRGRSGALLFIDLDNFKNLNDTLGHDFGDMLLQQVTQRLKSCIRESDTVARLGGDEFVVMLLDLSEQPFEAAAQTESIGEKMLAALSQPYQLDKNTYRCTASIGVTLFYDKQQATDELMKQADIAMYQAKKAGRNALRFFDRQMQESISARVSLEGELQSALEFRQFHLYYQIQVDSSNRPLGAEALIRWIHPARGMISPAHFIPLAEETGLILPIGLWVLETACAQLKVWQQNAHTRGLTVAVNVSARQFRQADFVAQVQDAVQRHAIDPKLLKLELTESLLQENIEKTIATMNALNDIGVQFSLDDFGTGYSSLQYLKRLPLDQLKIDQSFINDIVSDINDKMIVRTIIIMAQSLNMGVIAEGVETEEQRQFLLKNGCTHYQGYLFGRPVPIDQFESLLKQS
jgi:diguanylate cyclase (GGDEF)-like protein/PAS domain S-box-containing protein